MIFMYNAQQTAEKIKTEAKAKNILIKTMLDECGLSKNALSSMLSRGSWMQANNLAKIAQYLDCSVDYLLGLTEDVDSSRLLVDDNEADMLTMYRLLTDEDREDIFELIHLKYARAQGRRTESLYSTYTAAKNSSKITEIKEETA